MNLAGDSCVRLIVIGLLTYTLLRVAHIEAAGHVDGAETLTYNPAPSVGYGKDLFANKGRCVSCHGWAGDGNGQPHSAGEGANLRQTALSREQLIETISCGRPGTAMPHFDAYAYTDDQCYGVNETEIGAAIPPDAPGPLQRREIEAIVGYLQVKVIGRGKPTKAECIEFNGESSMCDAYSP